ncbi:ABC transporter ATP-binding protein [Paractinoplanes toevensis]|uniref:ABC transporter ATP-binding protein n=1 Tax=Paractinoplanes toevensis TaxID=571911 RepID=A0A919T7G7_9ACTN|nr:ABC transporter ATP-binding protein [Actinoplanes toevensis]
MTKRYGAAVAVDELSFQVRPGQVTGFLGPNGAGKSTTMRVIMGLCRPTSGYGLIDGRPYPELERPLRQVGAFLEAKAVHPGRSVYHHLAGLAKSNRIPESRVNETLALVGLQTVARKRAAGLSLGMAQRLGLAAALLGNPPVLLLDEPVNGLDPEGILWIRGLIRRLADEGRTILVSSHLMSEMALTASHLIVIGRGRLLADTTIDDFIARNSRSFVRIRTPEQERVRDVLTAAGVEARRGPDGAIEVVGASLEQVGELIGRHHVTVHEVSMRSASLEEAFMQLTADSVEYRDDAGPAFPAGRMG